MTHANVTHANVTPANLTPAAFADIKARLDRALKTASANYPLRLGPALHEAFAREGLFVERVFRTAHPPVVTAIFPTYEDRAVHRDATLAPDEFALGKSAAEKAAQKAPFGV